MEYHLLSDELLVKLIRVDDSGAFNEIYNRYWKTLFIAAQQKIASDEIVEEVLQNVFLKIWEKRATQEIENLGAYLYTATKYQIMDHYRAQFQSDKYQNLLLSQKESFEDATEQAVHLTEISGIFERVLSALPEKTSRIFHLSRLEFKSTKEIAQLMAIPERTVEYHITLSLKQLRKSLKDFLPSLFIALLLQV
ncbi:RNA polymerase sigma factor [Dyadobacter jejuensis]|nr:sigma-70 family RNA polymerase sigma factor [Dyadobacter jejuensis]